MRRDSWPPLPALRVFSFSTSFETARSTYGPFLLNRYALTWIVEGGGTTILGERALPTREGSVLCMTPGVELRHDWGTGRSFQSFVVFDPGRLPRGWPCVADWPTKRDLSGKEPFFDLWRYLLGVHQSEGGQGTILERGVELLLRMYVSGLVGDRAQLGADLPRAIERALDFLAERVETDEPRPRLEEVARAARVSIPHLCRLFRAELDASPLECAELLRLERAAGFLERGDWTLAEIAGRLAYSSAFHLSKNFKRVYGVPPSEYRAAFRQGLASRPGGLVFRNHRLRSYLYERGPGRVIVLPRPVTAVSSLSPAAHGAAAAPPAGGRRRRRGA